MTMIAASLHQGTFPPALYDEAKRDGWFVISMKDAWKRIFNWEE
jgi:hypothetical protein